MNRSSRCILAIRSVASSSTTWPSAQTSAPSCAQPSRSEPRKSSSWVTSVGRAHGRTRNCLGVHLERTLALSTPLTSLSLVLSLSGSLCSPQRKINTLGNQATNRFISWRFFDTFADCHGWVLKSGFKLVGVEIGARAKNISARPFSDKTIFVLGNEGAGLDQKTMDACDELVYIPQYGRGTASLNVATAASIVLHHFAEWAKYPNHTAVEGFKFVVDESKVRQDPGKLLMMQEQQAGAAGLGAAAAAGAAAASSSSSTSATTASAAGVEAAAATAAADAEGGAEDGEE